MWVLALCLLSAPGVHAQAADSVQAPDHIGAQPVAQWTKVRIRAPLVSGRWIGGLLVRMDGDSVVLERGRQGSLAVPRWQVERVQVEAGRDHLAGALRGAAVGIVAVAIPAVLVANAGEPSPASDGDITGGLVVVAATGVAILVGAIAGVQGWHDVPLPPLRSEPQPASAGTTPPTPSTPPPPSTPSTRSGAWNAGAAPVPPFRT
jgi:hypothetical protein